MTRIQSVRIKGFRSLADVELDAIGAATVLIGANGAGKSNVIRFFEMLSWMLRSRDLAGFVARRGGADDQLFEGSANTPLMRAEIRLGTLAGSNDYTFTLAHAHPDRLIFAREGFRFTKGDLDGSVPYTCLGSAHSEAKIVFAAQETTGGNYNPESARAIVNLLRDCAVFQFHNTSATSDFKKLWDVQDNRQLRSSGGNLAAILYRLQREDLVRYEWICRQINMVLPSFDRFEIEESNGRVSLRWRTRRGEKTVAGHLSSDGSLRLFALIALLNLPPGMLPGVIMLDGPELGLHPAAVSLVAELIRKRSSEHQVIVATQSPLLVDAFGLDEIVVLEWRDGRTQISRPMPDELSSWLEEYSTGELWQKNILGGQP